MLVGSMHFVALETNLQSILMRGWIKQCCLVYFVDASIKDLWLEHVKPPNSLLLSALYPHVIIKEHIVLYSRKIDLL